MFIVLFACTVWEFETRSSAQIKHNGRGISWLCSFYLLTLYSRCLLSAQPLIGSFPQIPLPVLCWAAHLRYNSTTTIENSLQKNAAKQYKKLQCFFNYYFIATRTNNQTLSCKYPLCNFVFVIGKLKKLELAEECNYYFGTFFQHCTSFLDGLTFLLCFP